MDDTLSQDQAKRVARMERIDAMPADIRACVHEYGLSIVQAMLDAGVKKGKHMHHIVKMVREGSFQSATDGKAMRITQARNTDAGPEVSP